MVGVRIQDRLGVPHVLNEIKRIHGVNDDVVIWVRHQRRPLDVLQIRAEISGVRAPFADGGNLCWHNPVADGARPQGHITLETAAIFGATYNPPENLWLKVFFLHGLEEESGGCSCLPEAVSLAH
jgi:hypothetical protein